MVSKTYNEEVFEIKGENLIKRVKELIDEGNVRKISILNKKEQEIIVLPLTVGIVGSLVAPVLAAVGAIAALVSECTIKVERI